MPLGPLLIKALREATDDLYKPEVLAKYAKSISEGIEKLEPIDVVKKHPIFGNPEAEEYIANSAKRFLLRGDRRKEIPVTEKEMKAASRVDPTGKFKFPVQEHLEDLYSQISLIRPVNQPKKTKLSRVSVDKRKQEAVEEYIGQRVARKINREQNNYFENDYSVSPLPAYYAKKNQGPDSAPKITSWTEVDLDGKEAFPGEMGRPDEMAVETAKQRFLEDVGILEPKALGRHLFDELIDDKDVGPFLRQIVDEFPEKEVPSIARYRDASQNRSLSREDRDLARWDFTRNSDYKDPVYRVSSNYHELDQEIAGVLSFESGTHIGTSPGQAVSRMVHTMEPDMRGVKTDFFVNSGAYMFGDKPTKKETRLGFKGLAKDKIDKTLTDYGEVLKEDPFSQVPYGMSTLKTGLNLKPYATTKGYINVENPLRVADSDWFRWEHDLGTLQGMGELRELVEAQGNNLTDKQSKELWKIHRFASRYSDFEEGHKKYSDSVADRFVKDQRGGLLDETIRELFVFKLHRDLREWFKSLGFDSLVYTNRVERHSEGAGMDSYVLFDNKQFKTAWSEGFDSKDPRPNKAEGGLIASSSTKRKPTYGRGGLVNALRTLRAS